MINFEYKGIIIDYKNILYDLRRFKEVSEANKKIVHKYIASIENCATPQSQYTIDHYTKIMRFVLKNTKSDLDKLTIEDIDGFQIAVNNWKRIDGKPVSGSTKKAYFIGFKRFLHTMQKDTKTLSPKSNQPN